MSTSPLPSKIAIIAGRGAYPLLLAESARTQGVTRVVVIAFKKETDPRITSVADDVHWISMGQLGRMLEALAQTGVKHAVMAGQITPTHLFRVRMDAKMLSILKQLTTRNAETIYGAICKELTEMGIELLPASSFMEAHMPAAGQLTTRAPSDVEMNDIRMGFMVAKTTSGLDIGQTVVVKEGTILAVEAFEGTDAAILRAGKLGGAGAVLIKVAKPGHDMRFDIPVIGLKTVKSLRKAKIGAVAVEAGKAIILERAEIIRRMNAMGIAFIAVDASTQELPS
ncbi:MAG: LpxI family protein [Verrucomicrobia bacterium]|jgi:UDP-2,3-diacylglucosamine hydrolase|nr:LpxI family protein [Verrucomicrobiota bacterium]